MRVIKFRAWDKEDSRMIVHEQKFQPLKVSSIGVLKLDPTSQDSRWFLIDPDRFILEQFTGLQDKNGKDIYEGDIVVWNINQIKTTAPVFYDNEWACFWMGKETGSGSDFIVANDWGRGEYEIIGNIHENKNLL